MLPWIMYQFMKTSDRIYILVSMIIFSLSLLYCIVVYLLSLLLGFMGVDSGGDESTPTIGLWVICYVMYNSIIWVKELLNNVDVQKLAT